MDDEDEDLEEEEIMVSTIQRSRTLSQFSTHPNVLQIADDWGETLDGITAMERSALLLILSGYIHTAVCGKPLRLYDPDFVEISVFTEFCPLEFTPGEFDEESDALEDLLATLDGINSEGIGIADAVGIIQFLMQANE